MKGTFNHEGNYVCEEFKKFLNTLKMLDII